MESIRYLKSVPKFHQRYIIRNNLEDLLPSIEVVTTTSNTDNNQMCDNNNYKTKQLPQILLENAQSLNTSLSAKEQYPNDFIHYCLFIFHGIYDQERMLEFSVLKEFKLRILMLNYRVKEAFSLCISDIFCSTQIIKIFEFFTKDSSVVPMQREDLKFMIYEMFIHIITNTLDVNIIEQFFLNNLDYYLFALAFILFFDNNSSEFEGQVLTKYANLFTGFKTLEPLEKSDIIFNAVSTYFKACICQRLIDYKL